MMRRPRWSTLFPYTTLFRSHVFRCASWPTVARPGHCSTSRHEPRPHAAGVPPSGRRHEVEARGGRSEEHTSELQSHVNLVCRLLLEKKKQKTTTYSHPHHPT